MSNLLPQDGYDSFLSAPAGDADTTLYVNVLPTQTAGFLTIFDIDGRTVIEKIKYSGVASSPNRLTTVVRGLALVPSAGAYSDAGDATLAADHPSNVRIAMTDNVHYIGRALAQLNGDENCGGIPKNPTSRTISHSRHLVDKEYADALTVSAVSAFVVTQNGADPSLTINVGAGTLLNGSAIVNYAGASAQAVAANQTNYIQLTAAGSLVINTSGFVAGNMPLAEVVTNGTDITMITDRRPWIGMPFSPDTEAALAGTSGTPSVSNKFVTQADTAYVNPTGCIQMFGGNTAPSGWLMCDGSAVSRTTYATLFALLFPTIGVVTMTIAAPGVVTFVAHGLQTGDAIYLTTTGALPTGLSANTKYWVTKVNADTFKLATTLANALASTNITTSGSQSGVHTAVLCPYGVGNGSTTFNLPNLKGSAPVGKDTSQTEFAGLGQTGGEKTHTLITAEMPAHVHTETTVSGGAGGNTIAPSSNQGAAGNSAIDTASTGGDGAHNNLQPYITLNYIIKT